MKISTKALATAFSTAVASLALAATAATAAPERIPERNPLPTPFVWPHLSTDYRMNWFRWHPTARSLQSRRFGSTVVVGIRSLRELASLRRRYGFERIRAYPQLHAAEVLVDRSELHHLLTVGRTDSRIRYVSPVGPRRHVTSVPSDPLVQNTDPWTNLPYEWQFETAHLDRAFDRSKGDPKIVVGIIDTGIDPVPDLAGKIDGLWSVTDDGTFVPVPVAQGNDDYGHGTAVASLIAANVGDGIGMAGFGGEAHVVGIRAGTHGSFTDEQVANALIKLDSLGVRIVNMSLGARFPSEPILVDAIHKAAADGVLLVASTGNEGGNYVSWPAADLQPSDGGRSFGLAVGATDLNGRPSYFSNLGKHLSLVAPGNFGGTCSGVLVALPSASAFDDSCYPNWSSEGGARYGYIAGTSFSAPEVAGVAALIWAVRPQLANYQVGDIIKQSSTRNETTGWTSTMGCGQLDAGAALELATSRSAAEWASPRAGNSAPCSVDGSEPAAWPREVDQTIAFGALPERTFGDPDFTVSATASSGLPVSFAASGNCTISGSIVHLTGYGACTITASQPGDADYNPALDVLQTFGIARAMTATALPAAGKWGTRVKLPYRIDGVGNVAASIIVQKNGSTATHLARGFSDVESGRVYALAWKAPKAKTKGTFRFCVTLIYQAHTKSAPSCARIRLR